MLAIGIMEEVITECIGLEGIGVVVVGDHIGVGGHTIIMGRVRADGCVYEYGATITG